MADRKQGAGLSSGSSAAVHKVNKVARSKMTLVLLTCPNKLRMIVMTWNDDAVVYGAL